MSLNIKVQLKLLGKINKMPRAVSQISFERRTCFKITNPIHDIFQWFYGKTASFCFFVKECDSRIIDDLREYITK